MSQDKIWYDNDIMKKRYKDSEDLIIQDYRHTGFAKALKVISLVVCAIYVAFLVYFLFFSAAGLFQWEFVVLLCFAAAPVLLMFFADVIPYLEYDRFRRGLSQEEYGIFMDEYAANRQISGTHDGIIVSDRIIFFMGRISVPDMRKIVWIYRTEISKIGKDNIVFLSDDKKFYITFVTGKDSDAVYNNYIKTIRQYSPDLMVGDTEENDRMYTEKYEHRKYKSEDKK